MTIECKGDPTGVIPFCTPSCTRWTQVNEGEPIRIFNDKNAERPINPPRVPYDPNYYPQVAGVESDSDVHLQTAIDFWEAMYPCGDLFQIVNSYETAQVSIVYEEGTVEDGSPLGVADCFCEPDGTQPGMCVTNADHSALFGEGVDSALLFMGCITIQGVSYNLTYTDYMRVLIHELGHILGIGHDFSFDPMTPNIQAMMGTGVILGGIRNPPVENTIEIDLDPSSYPKDLAQMEARYPVTAQ